MFVMKSKLILAAILASLQATPAHAATTPLSAKCGDGIIELGEQCDAGPRNSIGGSCLPTCVIARCGDGYLQLGAEQCDLGPRNGTPDSHCSTSCTID